MVRNLHAAGIEVILDVVYNHTARRQPSRSDAQLPRRRQPGLLPALRPEDPRFYLDFTGTGNTLQSAASAHAPTRDGQPALLGERHACRWLPLRSRLDPRARASGVNKLHAFFEIIHQDPVISQVKLIAEPWDVGEGGYQVGNFPVLWAEWNGKYRDAVRSFWKGDEGKIGELAYRLAGSPDLYQHSGRRPYASINFITAHDGFTLQRSRQLQRQTQRSQRRRQSRRRQQQSLVESRCGRPDRRSRNQRNCVASNAEISSPRSFFPKASRC